ncbi:MAG: hypothetical protein ACR2RE_12890 [Geminicoccaceae bacterium]
MADCYFDMPCGVLTELLSTGSKGFQASMKSATDIGVVAAGALQGSIVKKFDEKGVGEAMAEKMIGNTPIGSPTTAGP